MNRSCPLTAVAWALAVLCASMATGASAQPVPAPIPAPSDLSGDRLPAIQVTGSALSSSDAQTALPVTVLGRADIERSGARTTTELLQQLPMMQGMVQTSSVVGNDSRGYASVSIHNLGDAYTLVLLNGQRVAPFGGQLSNGALSGVDINTIPLAMVERIEVLADGASALYGADALGGVVNIITRRDGEANEATAGVTWPRGGAREWRLSAFKSMGSVDSTGQNLSLGVSAMRRSALRATARDYARDAVKDFTFGGQRYRFADVQEAGAPATIYDFTGTFGWGNPMLNATGACPSGSYVYNNPYDPTYFFPLCSYNYAADVDLVPEQAQHSLMASYTRQFAPASKLQLDLLLSRSVVTSHLAPVATGIYGLNVASSSPTYANYLSGLGVGDDPVNLSYRFVDLGRRGFEDTSDLAHLAARLDGRLHDWSWSAGLSYSTSYQRSDIDHALSANAAQRLFDDGFVNPVVGPGQQSAAELAAQRAASYNGHWLSGRSTLAELQWLASRELMPLPGGPLKWAVGVNLRHEGLRFQPSLFAQGMLSDPAAGTLASSFDTGNLRLGDAVPMQASSASRYIWGLLSEWQAPVTKALALNAAVRTDHDEYAGQSWTGKTSARWQAAPNLLWRASLGTGFRTPTLNQLRSPGRSDGVTQDHDCSADLQAVAVLLGAAPCTAATSYPLVVGGNGDLQPEKSVQANLGLRLAPAAGYVLGADLWAVHIHDRIGAVDEAVAFENPLAVPQAWTTVDTGSGPQLALQGRPANLGTLMSSGLDLLASARRPTAIGVIDTQLRATVMLREDSQLYPGGPWFSAIDDGRYGSATLKWRANWRTSLIRAGWTHTLTARYQSGYEDAPITAYPLDATGQVSGPAQQIRLKAADQVLWDWQTSWQLSGALQVTAGVINLLDTKPPLSLNQSGLGKGQMLGYDERYFDARGRMLTLEARLAF
ncbi:TonB-dependent receptor plug domain-containing protein [Aquabacterium sp.]|uniref:TonB-dependent receptor plug domain-containing protein n=1 Tax=Aquabacterium sp. TaxID=1872578 RepID=UPI00403824B9